MKRLACLSLVLLVACRGESPDATPVGDPPVDPAAVKRVETLNAAIASLLAAPENSDEEIEVQHVLIAFKGAQSANDVTRSKAEAEQLAADVFERAKSGEDFTALMKQYSTDPGPGIYPMTKQGRAGMVAGFGNVGFRLQPGMIGVAPYHQADSPFGWHIIKRLK